MGCRNGAQEQFGMGMAQPGSSTVAAALIAPPNTSSQLAMTAQHVHAKHGVRQQNPSGGQRTPDLQAHKVPNLPTTGRKP
jgi:hypothetical protein